MRGGKNSEKLSVEEGVKQYLGMIGDADDLPLAQRPRAQHRKRDYIFTGLKCYGPGGGKVIKTGESMTFEVEMSDLRHALTAIPDCCQSIHATHPFSPFMISGKVPHHVFGPICIALF